MIWEQVDHETKRARVPGGWLVKSYENIWEEVRGDFSHGWNWRFAMCFVPDPNREWIVEENVE